MKKKTTLLGIDPSLRSTGYCVTNKKGKVIVAGRIDTRTESHGGALRKIYDELLDIIHEHDVDVIVMESQFMGKNASTLITLAQVRGVIIMLAHDVGIELVTYPPAAVKKSFCGKGTASKKDIQSTVLKMYGHQEAVQEALAREKKKDDIADAIAIAMTHIILKGESSSASRRGKDAVVS